MKRLDPTDEAYIARVSLPVGRDDLSAITFWLTPETQEFIGTSLVYKSRTTARYWIPAATEESIFCENRWEMLSKIYPRKGVYLLYMKEDIHWNLISEGNYDHTLVDFYRQDK